MNIQSLSILVPAGCPNNCKFCVSKMHKEQVPNLIENEQSFRHLHKDDYKDALAFARDNGCNTLMFTGNGEPLLNQRFINNVAEWNQQLDKPFRNIELQTSGYGINQSILRWLRNEIRVKTISLSVSDIFDDLNNWEINGTPDSLTLVQYNYIEDICDLIKEYGFTLRLSINMNSKYDNIHNVHLFDRLNKLGVDQVTFRKLYVSGKNDDQSKWIKNYQYKNFDTLKEYILEYGRKLERLPYGAMRYSIHGISTVIDDDCMANETKNEIKYLILRPNCKLYTKWDDLGSILF